MFAQAREAAGLSRLEVDGATVGQVLDIEGSVFQPVGGSLMILVNKSNSVQVQNTPGSARLSPEQVWKILDRTFYTSYVDSVQRTNVQLVRQNGYFLRIAYEVRKPLVYNLDVVAKFDHSVELGRTDAVND